MTTFTIVPRGPFSLEAAEAARADEAREAAQRLIAEARTRLAELPGGG